MFFFPYRGAAQNINPAQTTTTILVYAKNQGVTKSAWKAGIVAAEDSEGAFTAMITAPRTHRAHPILPKKVSRSFKKIEERTALL